MCLQEIQGEHTPQYQQRFLKWALPPIIKNLKIVKSFSSNHISNHLKQKSPIEINHPPFQYNDDNTKQSLNSNNFINVYLDKLLLRKSESYIHPHTGRNSTIESKSTINVNVKNSNINYFNRKIEAYNNKGSNNNNDHKEQNRKGKYNGNKVEYNFLTEILERIRHRVSFISFKNKELYEKEVENIINEELDNLDCNNSNDKQNKRKFNRMNFTSYGIELNPMKMFPSHSNASNYEEIVSYKKSIKNMQNDNSPLEFNSNKKAQLRQLLLNEPSLLSFLMKNQNTESFFSMLLTPHKKHQNNKTFNYYNNQQPNSRNTYSTIDNNSSIKYIKKTKCSSTGRTTNESSSLIYKGNNHNKSNSTIFKDNNSPITEPNNNKQKDTPSVFANIKYKQKNIINSNERTNKGLTERLKKELPSMLYHTITECTNTTGEDIKNIIKPTQRYGKRNTVRKRTLKNNENENKKDNKVILNKKEKEVTKIIERNIMIKKLIKIGRVKARKGVDVILQNATYRNKSKLNKDHLLEKSSSLSELKSILSNSAKDINNKYSPHYNYKPTEEIKEIQSIKPIYHRRQNRRKPKTVIVNNIRNRKYRFSIINIENNNTEQNNNNEHISLFKERTKRRHRTQIDMNRGRENRKRRLSELANEHTIKSKLTNKEKEEDKTFKAALKRIKARQMQNKNNKGSKSQRKNNSNSEQQKEENEHQEQKTTSNEEVTSNNMNDNEITPNDKPKQPLQEIRKLRRTIRSDNSQILSILNSTEIKSTTSQQNPKLKLRNINISPQGKYNFRKDSFIYYTSKNKRQEALNINANIVEERKHFFKDLYTNEEVEKRKQVLLMKIGHDITYGISKGELDEKEQILFDKFREQIASLKATDDEEYVDFLEENFYLFQEELEDLRRQREIEKRINGFMFHLRRGLDNEKGKQEFHGKRARVVSAKCTFASSNPFDENINN